jgi:predicted nucleic acid-binding protein
LVKLVVAEVGSDSAAELWGSNHPAVASVLAYPEGRAALAAARRGGRLAARPYARALAEFEEVLGGLVLVGADEELAREAGALAEKFGLRGYDAVHLATALGLGDDETVMVTWDADLAGAAEAVGLAVIS